MKKSQRNISRSKIRRRRQMQKQRQRIESREEGRYIQEKFVFWLFLKRRKAELVFIVVLIVGVWGITLLRPDEKAVNEKKVSVSSLIEDQSKHWGQTYSHGYKIIAFTDTDIIHTIFDTLPKDLEINWKKLSVVRIQATQFTNTDEKIKIIMAGINYAPAGISDLTLTTTFTRRKGKTVHLSEFGELEFVVEIIQDKGEHLFCLFGLRAQ